MVTLMREDYLELELRFLLLRYGKRKVLATLAKLGDQTTEELQVILGELAKKPKTKRKQKSLSELVEKECKDKPEILGVVKALATRFENKQFLPQLKDVQRFLEQVGNFRGKARARTTAAPKVIKVLAGLSKDELDQFADYGIGPDDNDFAILAQALMGKTEDN